MSSIMNRTGRSWDESVDRTPKNSIQRENEFRTKKRFDSCKRKGHELVVLNSDSKEYNIKSKVKVKKFDADEDSDFEDVEHVLIRKNRMHGTSFKDKNEERVKKFVKNEVVQKRRKNNEGNVGKARKVPKVVDTNAEEPRRIQANEAGERVKISDGSFKGNEGKENFSGSGETIEATLSTLKEMYDMLMHQKKVLEDKINDSVKKYPKNPLVQEWKNKLNELFKEVATSEEPVQSQWWYDNEAEIERSLILATSHKQFDNSPIANCSIQMSKDYADFMNGSGKKSFHSTPPSKIEMPIPLFVVPFMNEQKGV
ncbi:unnamed protein product [Lactuca virosa]|uniref:Uncharacterized protein n=1 Tax=Lactuca virosa TaxID=75947 RepID=A0AAU9MIV6_9ASTR|nr:unnamed protein product [Lactuca virosa]